MCNLDVLLSRGSCKYSKPKIWEFAFHRYYWLNRFKWFMNPPVKSASGIRYFLSISIRSYLKVGCQEIYLPTAGIKFVIRSVVIQFSANICQEQVMHIQMTNTDLTCSETWAFYQEANRLNHSIITQHMQSPVHKQLLSDNDSAFFSSSFFSNYSNTVPPDKSENGRNKLRIRPGKQTFPAVRFIFSQSCGARSNKKFPFSVGNAPDPRCKLQRSTNKTLSR